MQLSTRSFRSRKTSPAAKLGSPRVDRSTLPDRPDAHSSLQLQNNLGPRIEGGAGRVDQPSKRSLRASFLAQKLDVSLSDHRLAPPLELLPELTPLWQHASEEQTGQTSLAENNLPLPQALEGETSQTIQEVPPPTQLDSDKLELKHILFQLGEKIANLQQAVGSLAELLDSQLRHHSLDAKLGDACAKHIDNKNNNNNNNNATDDNSNNNTHNTNHTHNNNNNDNNNKSSRESSLNSLDLDNDNPESEPDLDTASLGSFSPTLGVESSSRSLDQHEANLSLGNLGHKTMTSGLSLGSLIQQQQDDQEGKHIGTAWEPSLEHNKESFERTKPKKGVSFGKVTFAAYNDKQQNSGQQQKSSQLEQLEHKKQNNKENSCKHSLGKHQLPNKRCKTTLACWNLVPQEHPKKKAWQDGPSTMQQQPATASRGEDQLRPNTNNSLDGEELSLGSLEAEPQATKLAYRSPKHNNNNTSNLGLGTKNTAAYGILIDTGAAINLAPMSFAQGVELSPVESTLQLRTVTGEAIEAFGRRNVHLVGSNLSFHVSFVIANVQHALLGLDALMANQLSLIRNNFNEYYLVNTAGATTQLHKRGHLLYIEACPKEFGFSNCRGSSFPEENGSLLDDKSRTQEEAISTSGGAWNTSFFLENLRQQQDKNTATLGTTTLPAKGAKKKKEEEETFCQESFSGTPSPEELRAARSETCSNSP